MRVVVSGMAALALAACGGSDTQEADTATEDPAAMPPPAEVTLGVPSALQGRWGLTPEDCTTDGANAKGLLVITAERLEFYESVGTLDDVREVDEDGIRATFDFTGEGMEWERDMALELQDDGTALVRREYGADAAPGQFRYTKCA